MAFGAARGEWYMVLRGYWSKQPQLVTCPVATQVVSNNAGPVNQGAGSSKTAYIQVDGTASSYGLNLWAYDAQGPIQGRPAEYHWKNINHLAGNTANIPLELDSRWRGGGPDNGPTAAIVSFLPPDQPDQYSNSSGTGDGSASAPPNGFASYEIQHFAFANRHGNRLNALFMDGSAHSQHVIDLWKLKWSRNWDENAWTDQKFPSWIN
jgi:prepilin-type processing-associated H-X9-DG protein